MAYKLRNYPEEENRNNEYRLFVDFIENAYVICDKDRKAELINELIDKALDYGVNIVTFREKVSNLLGSYVKATYEIDLYNNSVTAVKRENLKSKGFPIYKCLVEKTISNSTGSLVEQNEYEESLYNGNINALRIIAEYNGIFTELVVDRKYNDNVIADCKVIENTDECVKSLGCMFNLKHKVGTQYLKYKDIFSKDFELLDDFNIIDNVVKNRKCLKKKIISM